MRPEIELPPLDELTSTSTRSRSTTDEVETELDELREPLRHAQSPSTAPPRPATSCSIDLVATIGGEQVDTRQRRSPTRSAPAS